MTLSFDPIEEAQRQWRLRWAEDEEMAAATSIMRAQQIVLGTVDAALRRFDLSFARFEALVLLSFTKNGSIPLGKMGARLMVHPTSVTNLVDRLERQGLLVRKPHPQDRRTTLAEITPAGRQLVTEAAGAVNETAFGLGMLSEAELRRLTAIVRKVRLGTGDFVRPPGDPGSAARAQPERNPSTRSAQRASGVG